MAEQREILWLVPWQRDGSSTALGFVMNEPRSVESSEEEEQPSGGKPWQSLRKAKVKRARKLAADPNYPPKKVMDSVADLLARHLDPSKQPRAD